MLWRRLHGTAEQRLLLRAWPLPELQNWVDLVN
jgi:hypothetical protein